MTGPQGAGVFAPNIMIPADIGGIGGGGSAYDDLIESIGSMWYSQLNEKLVNTEWETIAEAISTNIRAEATYLGGPFYFAAWWADSGHALFSYDNASTITIGGVIWFNQLKDEEEGSSGDPIGGTITTSGGFRYHTFLNADTSIGNNKFYPMDTAGKTVDLFAIAGGGTGGGRPSAITNSHSGGGGAGEVLHISSVLIDADGISGSVAAAVTAPAVNAAGKDGNDTVLTYNGSTTTLQGGSGGGAPAHSSGDGRSTGGSGGGGAASTTISGAGGAGSTGGNDGGAGAAAATDANQRAGGGGGAGGDGTSGVAGGQDGDGGIGYEWPTGSGTRYGGGGGGAGGDNGEGGAGGGGNGGGNPTANTGSGGGGWAWSAGGTGSVGAAGRMMLRYAYP
jgi:hypothetical protein